MTIADDTRRVCHWRLSWQFDVQPLLAELGAFEPGDWKQHFNAGYHDGGWSGLALISQSGDAAQLYGGHQVTALGQPTALLARCPGFAALLAGLPLQIQSARLLRLEPGSHISEHADDGIGLDAGTARLHIPIATAVGVEFYVNGNRIPMAAGECWYLDLGLPHRVQNTGTQTRVHLVLDVTVDDALRALLPTAADSRAQLQTILAQQANRGPTSQQRLAQFLAEVLRLPEWPPGWDAIDDPQELARVLQAEGAARGLAFTLEDVATATQAARRRWIERQLVGLPRPAAAPMPHTATTPDELQLSGWTPLLAEVDGSEMTVEWCRTGTRPFTEPFFADSLNDALHKPAVALLRQRASHTVLERALQMRPGLPLGGLIFHMSRCGSTLLSQVLASTPRHRMLSEPLVLDAAFQSGPWSPDAVERQPWLRALVGSLAQPGRASEERCYIKLDSWHGLQIDLITRTFPGVPWVFLMRDPVEIIVSHLRRPGTQMVPGMLATPLPGIGLLEAATMPRAEYGARMLGAICQAVLEHCRRHPDQGLLLDHSRLVHDMHSRCLPHMGVQGDAEDAAAARAALARDAKQPYQPFQDDTRAKQQEADAAVREAAERWVMPAYRELKARAD